MPIMMAPQLSSSERKFFSRRPLKPYSNPLRKKPMTIAAGFKYRDGILLCADREITEGASKYSRSKVFGEQISPDVSLGFAFSGSMDYAIMAIQGIIAVAKSSRLTSHAQIWGAIRDTIHEIYSDSIGCLPEYQQENFHFSLLIAAWAEGTVKLFTSENTAITEEQQFRCIGIGKDLARYLLTSEGIEGSDRMPLQSAETVSLRIVKHVKDGVPGCGQETDVLILDSNGGLIRKSQNDYRFELKMIGLCDDVTSLLQPFAMELDMPDEDRSIGFRLALSVYDERLAKIRAERLAEQQEDEDE